MMEAKLVIGLKSQDMGRRQDISKPFLQADNEIHQEIVNKRNDLLIRSLLSQKQAELYQKLQTPYLTNVDQPSHVERYVLSEGI